MTVLDQDPSGLIISSSVFDTGGDAVNADNCSIHFMDAHSHYAGLWDNKVIEFQILQVQYQL